MSEKVQSRRNPWLLPMLVGSLVTLVVVAVFWFAFGNNNSGSAASDQSGAEPSQQQLDLDEVEGRDESDPLAVGDVDAPVVMVMFSDYQCPFCASWTDETLPAMMEYVDDGDLRLEWRDLNMYGDPSERAAKASYAAGLQDNLLEYQGELFEDGEKRSEDQLTEEALVDIAGGLNLDVEQFTRDMNSDEANEQIQANQQLGTGLGVTSTPSFLIGGEPVVGAQPTEVFTETVDNALESAKE